MIIDAHAHADEYKLFGWIDPPERVISLIVQISERIKDKIFYKNIMDLVF